MANINTNATVSISVNDNNAMETINKLKNALVSLKEAQAKALASGDKGAVKRITKDIIETQKEIRRLERDINNVDNVLKKLDQATPKQLKSTLRTLTRQLNDMERGSEAWKSHVEAIHRVKTALQQVNEEMQPEKSFWGRAKDFAREWQMALMGVVYQLGRLQQQAREYVNEFAGIQQEMANVSKYTGMTSEQVAALNEELKKMDTRTSREGLNQLAQEAGRLGKTSQEEILGFVRAADQLNVALDDLGEGATLTLSKLTGVFGDEKRLGTEKSLLAVGSVINELSQNCAASAPYLADFAARMGGVGAQAGMTIQQIMGFGAVLDANQQQVEASSTALAQVITRMYQDPAKYAEAAGLEVKKFTELLKTDTNEAVLQFLEALNKSGGLDKLSPILADMGEKGSRAVTTLATLAGHIDEVRNQQAAANKAYEEGTSVTKEFEVQNNTLQAQLDKQANALHEVKARLGEQLVPVVKVACDATRGMGEATVTLVAEMRKHKEVLVILATGFITLRTGLALYNAESKLRIALDKAGLLLTKAQTTATKLRAVATALLTGNLKKAKVAMAEFNAVSKASIFGAITTAVTLATAAIVYFTQKAKEAKQAMKEKAEAAKAYRDEMRDTSAAVAEFAAAEKSKVDSLYKSALNEAKSKDERRKAAQALIDQYPAYFRGMNAEQVMLGQASAAYQRLASDIIKVAEAKAAAQKIEENSKRIIELRLQLAKQEQESAQNAQRVAAARKARTAVVNNTFFKTSADAAMTAEGSEEANALKAYRTGEAARVQTKALMGGLIRANNDILKMVPNAAKYIGGESAGTTAAPDLTVPGSGSGGGGKSGGGKSSAKEDNDALKKRIHAEEDANAQIRAINLQRLAMGEIDYEQYLQADYQATLDLIDKKRAVYEEAGKTESDAYRALLEKRASLEQKEEERRAELARKAEKENYEAELRQLDINYYTRGTEEYNNEIILKEKKHALTLEYLKKQQDSYYKNSTEWIALEREIQEEQDKYKLDKMRELEQRAAALRAEFDPTAAKKAQYDAELALFNQLLEQKLISEEVYTKAVQKLREETSEESQEKASQYHTEYSDLIKGFYDGWVQLRDAINTEGGDVYGAVTSMAEAGANALMAITAQVSSYSNACRDAELAHVTKKYDKEIKLAEGNSYKTKKAEKAKQKEQAAIKKKYNDRAMKIEMAQAVAQTAVNALKAYGAMADIPVIGPALGAIAAAMAIAAGAIQIASIKKSHQAEAEGYSRGGFTRKGGVNEEAGIVHAGEWVASQKLVNNPQTRPLIDALEYAQRHDRLPSIMPEDVSRTITAPVALASGGTRAMERAEDNSARVIEQSQQFTETMARLTQRLEEPFVTVNTVSGDHGIKQAQDKYNRLIANKTPKSRRS